MSTHSIGFNFVANTAYQLLNVVTALITAPYLARIVGANGVGVFSYTQSVAQIFSMFVMLGMSAYGVRIIAYAGNDRNERSRQFSSAYCLQLSVGVLVLASYLFYCLAVADHRCLALLWGLFILSSVLDVSWLLFGVEEFVIPTVRSLVTKVISVLVIFGFVKGPDDLWIYVLAIAGAFFLNQALIWPFVRRYVDFEVPPIEQVRFHLRPSVGLFVPVIAVSVYTVIDKVLLGRMSGPAELAFFDYSERFSRVPLQLVTALTTVLLPRMAFHFRNGSMEEGSALLRTSMSVMMFAAIPMALGIAGLAPEFMPWFLGRPFASSVPVMIVLSAIIPIISASNVLGRQYLLPMGRDREYTASLLIGAAVNIVLILVLVPRWGAMGAAVSTVTTEVAILVAQGVLIFRELPLMTYVRDALPFVLLGVLMYLCIAATSSIVPITYASWRVLVIEGICGAFAYVLGVLGYVLLRPQAPVCRVLLAKFKWRRAG